MRVVVHGSTGAQGAPVAAELSSAGHDVVAISRQPGPGVTVADLGDQASLRAAYADAEALFIHLPIPSSPEAPGQWVSSVLGALPGANMKRVVVSTSGVALHDAGPSEAFQQRLAGTKAFVDGLDQVADSVVALAPRLFLENLLLPFISGPAIADGVLSYPIAADKPISWISHRDVAKAVATALDPETEAGIYDLGIDAITGDELARRVGVGIGKDLRYEAISPAEFTARATPLFGPDMAAGIGGLYELFATDHTLEIRADRPQLATADRLTVEHWAKDSMSG